MEIKEIKKEDFISDYNGDISIVDLKEKYGLNNRSLYKIVDELKLNRKRASSKHKKIVLI